MLSIFVNNTAVQRQVFWKRLRCWLLEETQTANCKNKSVLKEVWGYWGKYGNIWLLVSIICVIVSSDTFNHEIKTFRAKQGASLTAPLRHCSQYPLLDEQTACALHLLNCSKQFCSTWHFPVVFPSYMEQGAKFYEN